MINCCADLLSHLPLRIKGPLYRAVHSLASLLEGSYSFQKIFCKAKIRGYVSEINIAILRRTSHPSPLPKRFFLVVTLGRAGSDLLGSLLSTHSQIDCAGELLHWPLISPQSYILNRAACGNKPVFGFKVAPHQIIKTQKCLSLDSFIRPIHDLGYKIIHLCRSNFLRLALSGWTAKATGIYHRRSSEGISFPKIYVDTTALLRAMASLSREHSVIKNYLAPFAPIELIYEKHLMTRAAQQATVDKIAAYFSLPPEPVSSKHNRVTPLSLREFVQNAGEVITAVSKSGYAADLEDPHYAL